MTASVPIRASVMRAPLDIAGGSIYDKASWKAGGTLSPPQCTTSRPGVERPKGSTANPLSIIHGEVYQCHSKHTTRSPAGTRPGGIRWGTSDGVVTSFSRMLGLTHSSPYLMSATRGTLRTSIQTAGSFVRLILLSSQPMCLGGCDDDEGHVEC
jgi:hypothetical protein